MDGDLAPLPELAALAQQHDCALMVDDAHGLGVLGEASARGTLEHSGVDASAVPILVGTLGKAFGTFGAFVAGDADLIDYLMQRARTYIYTTALPPVVAAASRAGLRLAQQEGWRRERLHSLTLRFRAAAASLGVPLDGIDHADSAADRRRGGVGAGAVSEALMNAGFWVAAIRPPTVPPGSVAAAHHAVGHAPRAGRGCAAPRPWARCGASGVRMSAAPRAPRSIARAAARHCRAAGAAAWLGHEPARVRRRCARRSPQHSSRHGHRSAGTWRAARGLPAARPQQQLARLAARAAARCSCWWAGRWADSWRCSWPPSRSLAVRQLVLIATSPRFVRADDWPHGLPRRDAAAVRRDSSRAIRAARIADFRRAAGARQRATPPRCSRPCRSALRAAWRGRSPPRWRAGLDAARAQRSARAGARACDVPALVIAGQYDRVTPRAGRAGAGAAAAAGAAVAASRRAGHAPFLSHPGQVGRGAAGVHARGRAAARWHGARCAAAPMSATEPSVLARPAGAGALIRSRGAGYDAAAQLQQRVRAELLERLQYFTLAAADASSTWAPAPARLARTAAPLPARARHRAGYRAWHAQGMPPRAGAWRAADAFERVCADAYALPLASRSVELVYSNLMLQWCDRPERGVPRAGARAQTRRRVRVLELRSRYAARAAPAPGRAPTMVITRQPIPRHAATRRGADARRTARAGDGCRAASAASTRTCTR